MVEVPYDVMYVCLHVSIKIKEIHYLVVEASVWCFSFASEGWFENGIPFLSFGKFGGK